MDELTLSAQERPVKVLAWQEEEEGWMTVVAVWPSDLQSFSSRLSLDGSYGKTSLVCLARTKEEILECSSIRWGKAGMGSHTEFLTLNISESPKDVAESSLSDILETGNLPQRYYLSGKACNGILERAETQGRLIPQHLREALEAAIANQPLP